MTESKRYQFIDSFTLKMIAVITMLIDHTGAVLFPYNMTFRYIGRLAFPIYVFLIVEGFFHTRNVRKYEIRLAIFALISEIPFDLAFSWMKFDWSYQNVFFTLCIGLIAIDIIDNHCKKNWGCTIAVAVGAVIIAEVLKTDYSGGGVVFIILFYKFRDKQIIKWILFAVVSYVCFGWIETIGVISCIPVALYNGRVYNVKSLGDSKSFKEVVKIAFYAFYPVHLTILYFISQNWNYGVVY